MEFAASTTISAHPDKVWEVLTDTERYPEWDPYCEKIEGQVALGNKIKAFSRLAPGRGFKVKVVELDSARRMTWRGGAPLGLFRGVRTFTLEHTADGNTAFTLREVFSGPMLKLVAKSLPDMSEAFEAFAAGLKQRCEGAA